jgi:hypothetical protein
MRIRVVFVKLLFRRVEGFKMEQGAAIKFCVKLKKTATETFEILKSALGEKCLSSTSVFECYKRFKEGLRVWECKNRGVKTMLTTFFEAKGIIHHAFVPDK